MEELLFRGHPDVVDADLADYFGSIPHADLLKSAARRIVDRRVLHLIKMWLECPVEVPTNGAGRHARRRPGITSCIIVDCADREPARLQSASTFIETPKGQGAVKS